MKNLINKVTEAKKAAEAALISRREETAAIRMQANTAKILENSPTLMRMRELEVLEKVASNAKRAATRKARHIMGKKQRLAITAPPETGTGTATGPAPVASGTATTAPATKPTA